MAEKEIVATDYPEGWEKALSLLGHIPEERREAYLKGFLQTIMTQ